MPTPSPKPDPKKPAPYKYKTSTTTINGQKVTVKRAMSTAELNAEKAKAPSGTSVWRDPSIGYDLANPPQPKKQPKGIQRAPGFQITPAKPPKGTVYPPGKIKRTQA
jgi:hypothetical protein